MNSRRINQNARDALTEAAIGLSLEKGFADMSVDEVCELAHLTKGAFFHYFKSKEALGKAILERWVANGNAAYSVAPFWEIADPLERVFAYIDFTIEMTKSGPLGCLVGVFSQELWQSYPEIRADCEEAFTGWAEGVRQFLEEAKVHHVPRAPFDPLSLAYHFIAVFEGGLILARAFKRRELVEEQLAHFKRYVRSLFDTENEAGKKDV